MRRAAASLAIVGLGLACAACGAAVDDRQAVLDVMLGELASSARTSGSTFCLAPTTDANAAVRQMTPNETLTGEWFVIVPGQASARMAADPALSRAADAARRGPHPVRALLAPGRTLPEPLRFTGARADCRNAVSLSDPSIQGDLAFVAQVIACGDNCHGGNLYALRREQGQWRVHAWLPLWVT